MFVTYVHMKPDLTPFYVGKGTMRRAHELGASKRNGWHASIVSKYGKKNIVVEIIECQSEEEAFFREKMVISALRNAGHTLCNMTDGGEGVSGKVVSVETRSKLSEIGRGKTLSSETRAKISEASKGRVKSKATLEKMRAAMSGKPLSEETRKKLSIAATGRKLPEEVRRKMSETRIGRPGKPISECARRKISESLSGRKLSEETIAKIRSTYTEERRKQASEAMLGKKQSKELIEKRIAPLRGVPLSQEHRNKIGEANKKTGAVRGKKISESLKGRLKTDEHRMKLSEAAKLRYQRSRETLQLNALQGAIEAQPGYSGD